MARDYRLLGDPNVARRPRQIVNVALPHAQLLSRANDANALPELRFVLYFQPK